MFEILNKLVILLLTNELHSQSNTCILKYFPPYLPPQNGYCLNKLEYVHSTEYHVVNLYVISWGKCLKYIKLKINCKEYA